LAAASGEVAAAAGVAEVAGVAEGEAAGEASAAEAAEGAAPAGAGRSRGGGALSVAVAGLKKELNGRSQLMEPLFADLVGRLQSAHSSNLISVVLYGSAIVDGAAKLKSDYRVLVVMNSISAEDLRHARTPSKWWADSGFSLPVYLTRAELNRSLTSFPSPPLTSIRPSP